MLENNFNQTFDIQVIKKISIADLKASMDYFIDEYRQAVKESISRGNSIKLCREVISFNRAMLKSYYNKKVKSISIKEVIYHHVDTPFINFTRVRLSNKSKINSTLKRLKETIALHEDYLQNDLNGGEYEFESLDELVRYGNECLENYYLVKNELASRFILTANKFQKKRITAKELINMNSARLELAEHGEKEKIFQSLSESHGYEIQTLRNAWNKFSKNG